MRSDTTLGKLTTLVSRLDVEKARELIAYEAPQLAIAVESIEESLRNNRVALLKEQSSQQHLVGDHIWHPVAGWGIVKGMSTVSTMDAYLHLRGGITKVAKKNFYVNLRMAAGQSPELKQSLDVILPW